MPPSARGAAADERARLRSRTGSPARARGPASSVVRDSRHPPSCAWSAIRRKRKVTDEGCLDRAGGRSPFCGRDASCTRLRHYLSRGASADQSLSSARTSVRTSVLEARPQTPRGQTKTVSVVLETVLFDLAVQRAFAHAQELGRFLAFAFGQLERAVDVIAFDFVQGAANQRVAAGDGGHASRVAVAAGEHGDFVGQVVDVQQAVGIKHDHPLDAVAELADIAGPIVGNQGLAGRLAEADALLVASPP